MASATDIVAYIYQGDIYCPSCVIEQLPTGENEAFDGWSLGEFVHMEAEYNLNEIALAFGIDRMDENTFDSDEFPKIVFRSMLDPMSVNICGSCFKFLDE